ELLKVEHIRWNLKQARTNNTSSMKFRNATSCNPNIQ
ncbi:unnamed protein product, partial [Allacma fusca]